MRKFIIRSAYALVILLGFNATSFAACSMVVGSGTNYSNLSTFPWPASGTVCINSRSYPEALVLQDINRTVASAITVQPSDASNQPNLQGGVIIRNSSYLTLSQVNASFPSGFAAVLIDQGSNHVTIDRVLAQNSQFGIVIGSALQSNGLGGAAGVGNVVQYSGAGTNIQYGGIAVTAEAEANYYRQLASQDATAAA